MKRRFEMVKKILCQYKMSGLLTVVALLSVCSYGQAQQSAGKSYSLKQCIETGIANNLVVQQSGLQMDASEINWKQTKWNMLPNVNGSVGHGINKGRSIDPFTNQYIDEQVNFANYNVNGGVVLFNGLSLQNTIRQTSLNYQASKMDWQQAKDNLTLNIALAYLQVLSNEDLLVQARRQAELSSQQVQRLQVLANDGAIRPSDLSDLKGQYANDQLAILASQNAVESAKLDLCQFMNIPYDNTMKLESIDAEQFLTAYAENPSGIYQTALSQFALVRSAELRTKSAHMAVKARRGELFPTLRFNAGASSNYSSAARQDFFLNTTDEATTSYVIVNGTPSAVFIRKNNFRTDKIAYRQQLENNIFSSFSLNLSIPLFNSLRARNNIKLAKIDAKGFELVEQTTKTQLQQNIERAHVNMTIAFNRYKTILDQVNSFTESFKAAEIRFNEGVGNSIDYLTAKNNLDRANTNFIISKYDYVLRTRILDYYQGKAAW